MPEDGPDDPEERRRRTRWTLIVCLILIIVTTVMIVNELLSRPAPGEDRAPNATGAPAATNQR